jgi:hypothetical protein
MAKKQTTTKTVEALKHDEATRENIPTAEYQSVMQKDEQDPVRVAYERRNRDLDPQLVWRGKDEQDWSDLVVHAPPITGRLADCGLLAFRWRPTFTILFQTLLLDVEGLAELRRHAG